LIWLLQAVALQALLLCQGSIQHSALLLLLKLNNATCAKLVLLMDCRRCNAGSDIMYTVLECQRCSAAHLLNFICCEL
jgi:hypothetical protein